MRTWAEEENLAGIGNLWAGILPHCLQQMRHLLLERTMPPADAQRGQALGRLVSHHGVLAARPSPPPAQTRRQMRVSLQVYARQSAQAL